jgi:hypothetical protein
MIQKAIQKMSPIGGDYTIMDACPSSNLPEGVQAKRLPAWLFPSTSEMPEEERAVQDALRKKLRPDILMVQGLNPQQALRPDDEIRDFLSSNVTKIHILEIGYCSDIDRDRKDEEKHAQHEQLAALLKQFHPPSSVVLHPPITLGRAGTVPMSTIRTLTNPETFSLSNPQVTDIARKLARHAIQCIDKFCMHRRSHEATHATHTHTHQGRHHHFPKRRPRWHPWWPW